MNRLWGRGGLGCLAVLGVVVGSGGCVLAAAGAGAGGAIYVTDRGVESLVAAPVERTFGAAKASFQSLGITESRSSTEHDGDIETRRLEGKTPDRDVSIALKTQDQGTKVEVVVRKSAVTWDKDFAREILSQIVEGVK